MTIKEVLETEWPTASFRDRCRIAASISDTLRRRGFKYQDTVKLFAKYADIDESVLDQYLYAADCGYT